MAELSMHEHGPVLPYDSKLAMVQVGWLGQTGNVYTLADDPSHGPSGARELGSYTPLYIAVGVWEDLGEGRHGIKD